MTEPLTKVGLAHALGVSRGRIYQLIDRGMPQLPDGRVDLEECCRWVILNVDPGHDWDHRSPTWKRALALLEPNGR